MRRDELVELHYIAAIANVYSIVEHGVYSHNRAKLVKHHSLAMPAIQERRAKVNVPGDGPLHNYVNLYFHARNPMMFVRKQEHEGICVLRIDSLVKTRFEEVPAL